MAAYRVQVENALVRLPRLLASRDAAPASSREASRLALAVNRFRVLPGLGINCMVRMFRTMHLGYFNAESVGPEFPRGSRLGPEGENRRAASIVGSIRTPMKQFCISSQFWSPQ